MKALLFTCFIGFLYIVFNAKGQTGKVFPLKIQKCEISVQKMLPPIIDYINSLPCVHAMIKETNHSTNEIICSKKLKEKHAGYFLPLPDKALIYLNNTLIETSKKMAIQNVLLHEIGHLLGLHHNKNYNSVMSDSVSYNERQYFDAQDIAFLQRLHQVSKGSICYTVFSRPKIPDVVFGIP